MIRRAHADEATTIADLYVRARRAAEPDVAPMAHADADAREWMAAQVEAAAGPADATVWVAEIEGTIVGLMITERDWLHQLYVDPDRTGRGIGSRLVDHAKAMSPGTVQLWTFASNTGAQRFYERHGFTEAERTDGSGNEERAPDIRYVWTRSPFPTRPGG